MTQGTLLKLGIFAFLSYIGGLAIADVIWGAGSIPFAARAFFVAQGITVMAVAVDIFGKDEK